jgi:hypothetical protein
MSENAITNSQLRDDVELQRGQVPPRPPQDATSTAAVPQRREHALIIPLKIVVGLVVGQRQQ